MIFLKLKRAQVLNLVPRTAVIKRVMALIAGWMCALSMAQAGQVTVSNYPLLLLSNAVTAGTHDAKMLLETGDVGHHGSLAPSKVKLISDSDFVVWFGSELEQNLIKSLEHAPNAIALYRFNAFDRRSLREVDGRAKPDSFDPHLWLNPTNAKAIVRALTVVHTHANPDHKDTFERNRDAFEKRLDDAIDQLPKEYDLKKSRPYWAYHDAYQYLESTLNLRFVGALTPDHHLSPKASQIKHLNDTRPQAAMCLVSQMPVSDGIVEKLARPSVLVRQEDMSDGQDFVLAWSELARAMLACMAR